MYELAFTWRSRVRIAAAIVVTFAVGVVAATTGVTWIARVLAGALFLLGVAMVLDAIVLTSSWRMTESALKVPTLVSRKREIVGRDGLTVALSGDAFPRLVVAGVNGVRRELVNPLVSGRDLHRWFATLPDG